MRVTERAYGNGSWNLPLPTAGTAAATGSRSGGDRTLVLAFGAPEQGVDPGWLRDLRAAYPAAHIVGCSSSGEIHGERLRDLSVAVTVTDFEHTELRSVTVEASEYESGEAIGAAAGEALRDPDLRAVVLLSDGTAVNGSALADGVQSAVGRDVAVSGGLAGDADRFAQTWVVDGDTCRSGIVVAVGLYGDRLVATHGTRGGWFPFGPRRQVTESDDNVLFSLDGRPALDLYREYLGKFACELPAAALLFPLCVWPVDDSAPPVVRTVLGVDDGAQSMTFAGSIPLGWQAQLMMANPDDLIDGAAEAAEELSAARVDGERLVLAVSCVGRRLLLGETAADELAAVVDALPDGSTLTGFYSYGEISPVEGSARLHNQTMTLTMFGELDDVTDPVPTGARS